MIPSNVSLKNGTPRIFRKSFPINVGFIPVLGPLEHEETLIQERTVQRNLATHRASRNFRNYWYYFPDSFEDFSQLVLQTWKGMEVEPPELVDYNKLVMFCKEDRLDRELYWAGFGFQVWCQLLTHIVRNTEVDLLIVDEPDIYLHPDMQRQILAILRDTNPDILLATHSTEIITEASPSEILLIDKTRRSATRLRDTDQVQNALDVLGSGQNITLTQLARTRRVLFVEGKDFRILSRFARQIGLTDIANQLGYTVVPSEGFSHWNKIKSLAWGFEKTLGQSLILGAIFDRDYRSDEEITEIKKELDDNLNYAHIHTRKELENYLLVPSVLDRAIMSKVQEQKRRGNIVENSILSAEFILDSITQPMRPDVLSQYMSHKNHFFREKRSNIAEATINKETIRKFDIKWLNINTRVEIVPGKATFSELNKYLRDKFHFNLTEVFVIIKFNRDDVPSDLFILLKKLEKFSKLKLP
jgi:energy-coupling factor transporter ATP-binding protein EcfA2